LPKAAAMVKFGLILLERRVGFRHFLGLGVEARFLRAGIVHAVFLAAGHAEFDLERHAHLRHALEILRADFEVLVQRLLGEVEHVRAVERLAGLGELLLARGEQAVDPRQQLLRAMIGVQNNGHAVSLRRRVHVVCAPAMPPRIGPSWLSPFTRLADEELRAAIGKLDHRRRIHAGARRPASR
jgi:hypothetical protein